MQTEHRPLHSGPPALHPALQKHAASHANVRRNVRALIVGAGDVGRTLARNLEEDGRYTVVGFVDDVDTEVDGEWPVIGRRDQTEAIVETFGIDEVFLAWAPTWQQQLADKLAAKHRDVKVCVVPSVYEAMMSSSRVQNSGDLALVWLNSSPGGLYDGAKRAFDCCCAILGLLLLAPVMLVTALLVKLTSPGPIIFSQERIGLGGARFLVHKFRTMVQDAEQQSGPSLSAGKRDSRLTPLGRWLRAFRLDELPQLWNVLRGEMSLVGPRPERPFFVDKFESMAPTYARRHEVRPGITGLAQVCAGYHTDARDKLRFDLLYVAHRSLWLDLSILVRTVLVIVCARGK